MILGNEVDVTQSIECYAKGKTWECECGSGAGTEYGRTRVKCYSCGKVMVDEKGGSREPPTTDDEQMTLGGFT
jgi:hypothetical protein